jgi:hypothetical protein
VGIQHATSIALRTGYPENLSDQASLCRFETHGDRLNFCFDCTEPSSEIKGGDFLQPPSKTGA